MKYLEFHPGDGGKDANNFALELANAIARFSGAKVSTTNNTITVPCL